MSQQEGTSVTCRICGSIDDYRLHIAREIVFGLPGQFEYYECNRCGCLQIATVPENLGSYYPKEYYSFHTAQPGLLKGWMKRRRALYGLTDRGVIGRMLTMRWGVPAYIDWVRQSGLSFDHRILDVGCGAGTLLVDMADLGFRHLTGIDPFVDHDVSHGSAVQIFKKGIDQVEERYDFVMLHHSFEHVPEPAETLRHVARVLRPGGQALIRIPVADSYAWRTYGVDWAQLDAPRHLYLHTRESMRLLASGAGFTIERIGYDSDAFQFWASEQVRLGVLLTDPRSRWYRSSDPLISDERMAEFVTRAQELNRSGDGDSAAFFLRRQ